MGLPNRDEIEGKWDQAKGKTKETVGELSMTMNSKLRVEPNMRAAKLKKASARPAGKLARQSKTSATP